MNIFESPYGSFQLDCPQDKRQSLKAWNQADIYLLNELKKHIQNEIHIAILNDQYGALSCALSHFSPAIFSDSATSFYWIKKNLKKNKLSEPKLLNPDQLITQEKRKSIFVMRIPKNLDYYEFQLDEISKQDPGLVLIAGMQKHLSKSYYEIIGKYFSTVNVLQGVKKAKCIIASNAISDSTGFAQENTYRYKDAHLINYPNVFSRERLDIGSRFFIDNMNDMHIGESVLDLGCGNGLLGICMLQVAHDQAHCTFIDESYFATKSTKESLKATGISDSRYSIIQANGLEGTNQKFDTIFCNPPFHSEYTITEDIAYNMMKNSRQHLTENGKLYLIGNRHLHYMKPLKALFSKVDIIAQNPKFIIYEAY